MQTFLHNYIIWGRSTIYAILFRRVVKARATVRPCGGLETVGHPLHLIEAFNKRLTPRLFIQAGGCGLNTMRCKGCLNI